VTLRYLRHAGKPASQLRDDLVLERAQLGEIDFRLAERDPVMRKLPRRRPLLPPYAAALSKECSRR
jgi:hypothetical protein